MWKNLSNGAFFPFESNYLPVFLRHWIFLGFVLTQSRAVYFSFWPPKKTQTPTKHHYSAALTPARRSVSLESPEVSKTLSNPASREVSTDFSSQSHPLARSPSLCYPCSCSCRDRMQFGRSRMSCLLNDGVYLACYQIKRLKMEITCTTTHSFWRHFQFREVWSNPTLCNCWIFHTGKV